MYVCAGRSYTNTWIMSPQSSSAFASNISPGIHINFSIWPILVGGHCQRALSFVYPLDNVYTRMHHPY